MEIEYLGSDNASLRVDLYFYLVIGLEGIFSLISARSFIELGVTSDPSHFNCLNTGLEFRFAFYTVFNKRT